MPTSSQQRQARSHPGRLFRGGYSFRRLEAADGHFNWDRCPNEHLYYLDLSDKIWFQSRGQDGSTEIAALNPKQRQKLFQGLGVEDTGNQELANLSVEQLEMIGSITGHQRPETWVSDHAIRVLKTDMHRARDNRLLSSLVVATGNLQDLGKAQVELTARLLYIEDFNLEGFARGQYNAQLRDADFIIGYVYTNNQLFFVTRDQQRAVVSEVGFKSGANAQMFLQDLQTNGLTEPEKISSITGPTITGHNLAKAAGPGWIKKPNTPEIYQPKNNPRNVEENPARYIERKKEQFKKIERLIQQGSTDRLDAMALQEIDFLTQSTREPFTAVKIAFMKMLKKHGYELLQTEKPLQGAPGQQPLALIYNPKKLKYSGISYGALPSERAPAKYRAHVWQFTDKKTGKIVRIMNVHGVYGQQYTDAVKTLQNQDVLDGVMSIYLGDWNTHPNKELKDVTVADNQATSFDAAPGQDLALLPPDNIRLTTVDEETAKEKCYDFACVTPPTACYSVSSYMAGSEKYEMRGGEVVIISKEREPLQRAHQYISEIGAPFTQSEARICEYATQYEEIHQSTDPSSIEKKNNLATVCVELVTVQNCELDFLREKHPIFYEAMSARLAQVPVSPKPTSVQPLQSLSVVPAIAYQHYVSKAEQIAKQTQGRWHFFQAGANDAPANGEAAPLLAAPQRLGLKGDALKSSILRDFAGRIGRCESSVELQAEIERIKVQADYKTLATGQGIMTRLFSCITTDSIIAFEAICQGKREQLEQLQLRGARVR